MSLSTLQMDWVQKTNPLIMMVSLEPFLAGKDGGNDESEGPSLKVLQRTTSPEDAHALQTASSTATLQRIPSANSTSSLQPLHSGSSGSLQSAATPAKTAPAYPFSNDFNSQASLFAPLCTPASLSAHTAGGSSGDAKVDLHDVGFASASGGRSVHQKDPADFAPLPADYGLLFHQQQRGWLTQRVTESNNLMPALPGGGSFGQAGLPGLYPANMQPKLDALSMCTLAASLPDWAAQLPGSRAPLSQINPWQAPIFGCSLEQSCSLPDLSHTAFAATSGHGLQF